jgi:hypothetical protein
VTASTTVVETSADRSLRSIRRRVQPFLLPLAMWAVWRLAHLFLETCVGGRPGVWWDDGYYRTILRQGYRPFEAYGVWQQTNFFPLLPWLTGAVKLVVRSEDVAIQVVLSAAQVTAVLFVFIAARRWRSERVAVTAVALMLLVPPSVFLWMFYTEGLFIALSAAAILSAEDGRMARAGLLGIGVAATRSIGVLIVIPLVLCELQHRRRVGRRLTWCALPLLGPAAVMLAQWGQAGDPLAFVRTSKHWETHAQLPVWTFVERLDHAIETGITTTTVIDVAAVFVVTALGVRSFRVPFPWSHRAWLWIVVLAPLSSGLIFSWSRYMFAAWPAILVGAEAVDRSPRTTKVALAALLCVLTVNRVIWWHDGQFIG